LSDQEQDNVNPSYHREGDAVVFDRPVEQEEAARQRRENEQHEFARSQVKTNNRLAWFTGALMVATFCTIAVGVWQGIISQEAANAARDAANAAKCAANIAQRSLAQSVSAFQLDERPWVYISSFGLTSEPMANQKPPTIDYFVMNSGKTPALNLATFYETSSIAITSEPPLSKFKSKESARESVLPPNIPGNVIGTLPVNSIMEPTRLDQYNLGKEAIYIQVKITYSDAFKKNYWTTACAYHAHTMPPNLFTLCRNGNQMGEEKH
jgi:hypothetical protein